MNIMMDASLLLYIWVEVELSVRRTKLQHWSVAHAKRGVYVQRLTTWDDVHCSPHGTV